MSKVKIELRPRYSTPLGVFGEGFDGGFNCFLGSSFMWVLGVMGAFWLGGLDGFFCCFGGSGFVRALLYATCVRRGALNFFNKLQPYLSKKISFIEAQTTKGLLY
jgi:hypothetical protein